MLQPKVSETEVVDEWKIFQVDPDLPSYDAKERIEVFWRKVFALQSPAGDFRYKALPVVVKSALVRGQTNAQSEQSLSVNARIVTQDRASLDEKTIVGLHVVKDAVRFFDPLTNQPELIPVEPNLKRAVKSAHAAYKGYLEKQKTLEENKREEERRQKEITDAQQKQKAKLLKKKESLAKSEEDLNEQEKLAREELQAADELLRDAKSKLDDALSATSVNKSSVTVAKMMLDTATTKHENAMTKLDKIREEQKSLETTTHKLLDEVLPSTEVAAKKRKGQGEEYKKGQKKLKE